MGESSPSVLPIISTDSLDHETYAARLLSRLSRLPNGWAVALRGPWGRGKTDVLGRVHRLVATSEPVGSKGFSDVIAISPWQHPQPDLLTPLVVSLLERLPKGAGDRTHLKRAAISVLSAGLAFGVKAAARIVPLGGFAEDASGPLTELVKKLIDGEEESAQQPDSDPTSKMGERFRELVEAVLQERGADRQSGRLLICIDDLDRCLPEKQVAFLEAIHFVKTTGARAIFLVAIDPRLLREAVGAHFGTDSFDADAYVEKLFEFSQQLPELEYRSLGRLVQQHLNQQFNGGSPGESIFQALLKGDMKGMEKFVGHFQSGCKESDLSNPRVVERACRRLEMVALAGPSGTTLNLTEERKMRAFTIWLAATQRWPESRGALSHRLDDVLKDANENTSSHTSNPPFPDEVAEIAARWPSLVRTLNVFHGEFLKDRIAGRIGGWRDTSQFFGEFDGFFCRLGL